MRWIATALIALAVSAPARAADEIVVYSERKEPLIKPLFERYERETGTKVRWFNDQGAVLVERLAAEGENTRADLFMAVDAGTLWQAAERGLLAPVDSATLERHVPANLRDAKGRWFGLSQRARTIVHSTERVKPSELGDYADLADAKWKGRLCLRSAQKIYNQSLVAMLIRRLGAERTEAIVRGWVANLAAPPLADDTLLIQAIAAGQCDVGIVNSYYLGRLLKDDAALPVALHWADQRSGGVHVNISGAGVTTHAPNRAAAVKFLEWLASPEAQREFAAANLEYPVDPNVSLDPIVAKWGAFERDPAPIEDAGRLQGQAVQLMDRAGWR